MSHNVESTMREAALASLGVSRGGADTLDFSAGINAPTVNETGVGSSGV